MARQSNSWGHVIQRLGPDWFAKHAGHEHTCTARNCDQSVTHLTTYNYVTGRVGRVSWASRLVCDTHAERFRAKHDLPAPEVAPVPRHALERILKEGRP